MKWRVLKWIQMLNSSGKIKRLCSKEGRKDCSNTTIKLSVSRQQVLADWYLSLL
jgi:hypothetical protein